jgi:hypothetical protein
MRPKRNRGPHWNVLNLIVLLTVVGMVLEHGLHLTPTGHKIVLLLITIAIYGLMGLWIKSSEVALQDLDDMEYRRQSCDPATYGTVQFPTRTQAYFRNVLSSYRHELPPKR